jgi:hypothetical protein
MSGPARSLWRDIETFEFEANEEQAFFKHIDELNSKTSCLCVADPSELMLDMTGTVRSNGLKFTTQALDQLCNQMLYGLKRPIKLLAGEQLTANAALGCKPDIAAASSVLNTVIKSRFNALAGCKLIVNDSTKSIDGVIGSTVEFTPHSDTVYSLLDHMTAFSGSPAFHYAHLNGRSLMLFLLSKEPKFPPGKTTSYHWGVSMLNSEIVPTKGHLRHLVCRMPADLYASGVFQGERGTFSKGAMNSDKYFGTQIAKMHEAAEEFDLLAAFRRLKAIPWVVPADRMQRGHFFRKWQDTIGFKGSFAKLSLKILHRTYLFGSSVSKEEEIDNPEELITLKVERTLFDLFTSAMYYASISAPSLSGKLQQFAFNVLKGDYDKR